MDFQKFYLESITNREIVHIYVILGLKHDKNIKILVFWGFFFNFQNDVLF